MRARKETLRVRAGSFVIQRTWERVGQTACYQLARAKQIGAHE